MAVPTTAKGNRREERDSEFFKLAWPSGEKVTQLAANLYKYIDRTSSYPDENAISEELELFECAVAEEGKPASLPGDFVPRGSKMRAILRDEIYRAVQDASESSGRSTSVSAKKRVSIQFVTEEDQSRLRLDLGRRVQWGGVEIKEFEKPDKEWDQKTEERVQSLKSQYNGAELEVVYRLLVDEYMTAKPVLLVTPTGKKLRSSVCVNKDKLFVTKEIDGVNLVDVAVRLSEIAHIQFGRPPSLRLLQEKGKEETHEVSDSQYLYIVFKANARRSSATGLCTGPGQLPPAATPGTEAGTPQPLTVSILFSTEAERNSFALLLRTSMRLVHGSTIGDWEDTIDDSDEETATMIAFETIDELFDSKSPEKSEDADKARLIKCLTAFGKGVNVQKATSKGTLVVRRLSLAGASLQLLSLKSNKGQVVGVFDDVLAVVPGQDDDCFRALAKKQQLPSASLCAVVKLTDHSFALIFQTQAARDNFVFMMKHLDESDEMLRYVDDGSQSEPTSGRAPGGSSAKADASSASLQPPQKDVQNTAPGKAMAKSLSKALMKIVPGLSRQDTK
ncbi:conserved hypothetical protein [Neospora caninum Liverpool]|uniref:Uncharacterized protein n=1 Tax=Neospora caninum (strain Liverpool) TaxID=572307 RepID=F0VBB7_NEOCL|nr:conserved hypothetical protein [Neospora caninum Liverpool]CBZ50901.1 conserved hypothetical protein [Neospora caninum Liverpool]CEL68203.1 TPA: hypothetical protein BN1204_039760 [Neospora caninum Liverpool]|eukprot:XP_003880934.1 conserved hypothetical protein [Neospora caninum Liverpool]